MMELGAKGVISVTANGLPNLMRKLCDLGLNREFDKAYALQEELEEMHQALFYESNPIPVKWVMSKLLNLKPDLRLPLTELDPKFHEILNQLVEKYRSI